MSGPLRGSPPVSGVGICTASLLADPLAADADAVREAGRAAIAAGFTEASVWAQHLDALAGVGLRVAVVEAAMAWANAERPTAEAEARRLVATAERVGASTIMAVCLEPRLADLGEARRNLEVLVALAGDIHARVCVEFLPWTGIPDLATAWDLVEPLGPRCGIVLDTWHWVRQPGGPAPDVLARIPGERIGFVQVSDAAAGAGPDLVSEAMTGRLLPGDGIVDFAELATHLAAIGATPFVAAEVFNPALVTEVGPQAAATAMHAATTRLPALGHPA
jgi:sugar phosphate isomerase/epimerase